ncbi:YoaK family protein [Streptomyces radicis]|uniref:DUF1275 domain-containing protein n=2 Tax=Streptomyces radicis TaxID=1750517 RepID=A0A3A9WGZ5_9ACTN|nr:YoaK family protein [Streptomyces radicis]RKN12225.1 DUF1275 domain-containing protein [Streptomyces radicis]RKN26099.1 DUF1275 domain-containing protein [Streptomyces radicis]
MPGQGQGSPLVLLMVLTFAAGMVDAVSFLSLGGVFAGNMTGNLIILGAAVPGTGSLPVLGPAVVLAAFAAGAALGGLALRSAPPKVWAGRHTALLCAVVALVAGSAPALFAVDHPDEAGALLVSGALALALGGQAATARHLAVRDVPTVVVTSTFTGLMADGPGQPWVRRAVVLATMGAGAAAGAGLIRLGAAWALLAAAAIALAVAVVGQGAARGRSDTARHVVKSTTNRVDRAG